MFGASLPGLADESTWISAIRSKTLYPTEMFTVLALLISAMVAEERHQLARVKRQTTYYICGVVPNRYYSPYPCNNYQPYRPAPVQCFTNGGRRLNIGCTYDYQCTPFSTEPTVCICGCCYTRPIRPPIIPPILPPIVPIPLPTTVQPIDMSTYGYCYNGERSQMRCPSSSVCSGGQTCINGLCCRTTGNEWQNACAGQTALASCTNGSCGEFVCTTSNYCCECEFGRSSGLCSQGCSPGFICSANGYCCPSCPRGEAPYGSCFNGLCASGYSCRAGNICCS